MSTVALAPPPLAPTALASSALASSAASDDPPPRTPAPGSLLALPPDDRPRERLLRDGAHTLDSAELLALVLGTGRGGGEDALQLARRVLGDLGGVDALAAATPTVLQGVVGIGPVKSARLRAAFELCLRAGPVEPEPPLEPPEAEVDPLEAAVARLRGQIPTGESAVIGYRPGDEAEPITLALGESVSPQSRLGSYLARLLSEGLGPWWVVSVRPGGKPKKAELTTARRLRSAAELVGIDLEHILLLGGSQHWFLGVDP